jgi:small subunit ribosomal protein S6
MRRTVVKNYEAMFLLESGQAASHWSECHKEIENVLTRHGCEIIRLVKWDDRKLAYEIARHKRGTYVLAYFKAPFDAPAKIERDVQLSETLLRVLLIRREKMTEEAMLRQSVPSREANLIGAALEPLPVATPKTTAPAAAPPASEAGESLEGVE